jgi:thioredoxin-related protein
VKKSVVLLCLVLQSTVFAQEWNTDLTAAKQKATASNKNILLVFSGPGWCQPCNSMEELVWRSDEFKAAADKHWVLLRADFPKKEGNPDPVNVNDMKMILTEKYNRDGFFPFFVLLDKHGKIIGKSGYEAFATASEYINLFRKLDK